MVSNSSTISGSSYKPMFWVSLQWKLGFKALPQTLKRLAILFRKLLILYESMQQASVLKRLQVQVVY